MTNTSARESFRLGDWIVHPQLNRLEADGRTVQLEPRPMAVLACLADSNGAVVSRDELLDRIWGDVVVGEEALTRAVSELRRALGDDPASPRYIETIRKGGYRLVASVGPVAKPVVSAASAAPRRGPWLIMFIAVAIIGFWFLTRDTNEPVTPLTSTPLTSFPGEERWPALSPDGTMVAFAWNGPEQNQMDIWVNRIGEATPHRLTDLPGWNDYPVWMPDGETVSFIHEDSNGVGIYAVPLLGGEPRRMLAARRQIGGFCWLDGGRRVVFSDGTSETSDGDPRQLSLYLRDLETGEERRLTTPEEYAGDYAPLLSPDGGTIAFVRLHPGDRYTVYLMPPGGGEPRAVLPDHTRLRGLSWTADSDALVISSSINANYCLWRVDVDDGALTWIPIHGEWMFSPSVAANADRLVYQHRRYEKNIWRVRRGATPGEGLSTAPIITSSRWDCEARYSPDGNKLAFISTRSGFLELWTCHADGTRPVQLTDFGGPSVSGPRWSPDGRTIAFSAGPDGFSDLFLVDPVSHELTRLTDDDTNAIFPSWSIDGASLTFSADRGGDWDLWRLMIDGNEVERLTTTGGLCGRESTDGRFIYFARHHEAGLWRLDQDDGSIEQTLDDLPHQGDWNNWDLWSGGIVLLDYNLDGPGSGAFIVEYDLAADTTTTLTSVPSVAAPSIAVSRDGRDILYARIEQDVADLILVDGFR